MEYFKCEHDCAVFVAMDRLSELEYAKSNRVQTHSPQTQDNPLKLGDVVTFFDGEGNPVNGIVRWVGRNREILPGGTKIIGIETVGCMCFLVCVYIQYIIHVYL